MTEKDPYPPEVEARARAIVTGDAQRLEDNRVAETILDLTRGQAVSPKRAAQARAWINSPPKETFPGDYVY